MNYNLSRITTQYIDNEDRLRILGESGEDKICEIWLTHRLMDRLVENLLSNVQNEGKTDKALQVFEQEVASSTLPRQAPVEKDNQIISWLAITIDIKKDNENISLNKEFTVNLDELINLNSSWFKNYFKESH